VTDAVRHKAPSHGGQSSATGGKPVTLRDNNAPYMRSERASDLAKMLEAAIISPFSTIPMKFTRPVYSDVLT
jgi:hypothetical protein